MGKTYYDSTLTDEKIQQVLDAINNILSPSNNGKVLAISGGTLAARSVQWGGGGGYPEPTGTITLTENGLHNVKDYAEANVQVQGGGSDIEVIPLTATANAVYTAPTGKAYSPVTVNVSGGDGDDPFALANYIQSSGTQWIDTGYIPTLNTRIELVAKVSNNTGVINCLLGARDAATSDSSAKAVLIYAGATGSNVNTLYSQFSGNQNSYSDVMTNFFNQKAIYRLKRGRGLLATKQWDYYAPGVSTGSSVTSTRSIYLFALHNVNAVGVLCPCYLYRARFYENDMLAMELLPWVDDNNVVCLKDSVSGNLFYNSGTGNFVYGTDA